ncbi:telomeric repeat-binding factor 2-interacting protein 1-like [Anneissia japonica]|uniref:telomeric repeat-binding factor 2-interacting protein 1-like n=1 Tax=Anneissia japonica TaxID=1529436 RepID=UPI001425696B|nr:telomeric repeat-binding factor 2-interacting protein 1-like [Anneissia japonica]
MVHFGHLLVYLYYRRNAYTVEEDNVILMYVAEHQGLLVGGNRIWKQMEDTKITIHTWQSMKDRYLKKLKDRLPEFKEIVKNHRLARKRSSSESMATKAGENEEPSPQNMQVGVDTDTDEDRTWTPVHKRRPRIQLSSDESSTGSITGKSNIETQMKTTQQEETQTSGIPTENVEAETEMVNDESSDEDFDVEKISRDVQKFMKKYGLTFEECAYVYYINKMNTKEVEEWFIKLEQKER